MSRVRSPIGHTSTERRTVNGWGRGLREIAEERLRTVLGSSSTTEGLGPQPISFSHCSVAQVISRLARRHPA